MADRTKEPREPEELDRDELEEQDGEALPDREVMSILPVPDPTGLPPGPATIAPVDEPPLE